MQVIDAAAGVIDYTPAFPISTTQTGVDLTTAVVGIRVAGFYLTDDVGWLPPDLVEKQEQSITAQLLIGADINTYLPPVTGRYWTHVQFTVPGTSLVLVFRCPESTWIVVPTVAPPDDLLYGSGVYGAGLYSPTS